MFPFLLSLFLVGVAILMWLLASTIKGSGHFYDRLFTRRITREQAPLLFDLTVIMARVCSVVFFILAIPSVVQIFNEPLGRRMFKMVFFDW